jgi:hypothetical protein
MRFVRIHATALRLIKQYLPLAGAFGPGSACRNIMTHYGLETGIQPDANGICARFAARSGHYQTGHVLVVVWETDGYGDAVGIFPFTCVRGSFLVGANWF